MCQEVIEPLTYKSWISLLVFIWIIFCTVRPFRITLKRRGGSRRVDSLDSGIEVEDIYRDKYSLLVDYAVGAAIGLLVLLITLSIGVSELKAGIIGDEQLQPYTILIILFSLSYICISIDITKVFDLIAQWTAERSGDSQLRLFWYFYLMNTLFTLFVSAEIVVMTMTPLIIQYGLLRDLNVWPFILAEFIASNTWSLVLVIGSNTNIIVATAEGMSFAQYTAQMILPCIGAALVCILMLFGKYYRQISTALRPQQLPSLKLGKTMRFSAIVGFVILFICLVLLLGLSFTTVPLWIPTLVCAGAAMMKDLAIDLVRMFKKSEQDVELVDIINEEVRAQPESQFCLVTRCFKLMPWRIFVFIIVMFILVDALNNTGWISRIALVLNHAIRGKSIIEVSLIMSLLTSICCVFFSNQPMTIVFTRVLYNANFMCGLTERQIDTCALALILGSNLGVMLSVNASLAGLMLDSILKLKGRELKFFSFMWNGFFTTIPAIVMGGLIIGAQMM